MTQLIELSDEVREALSDVRAHAAGCGRLDCGHLGKSTSQAIRRAVYLYQCEGAGMILHLDRVTADVAAVVGVLREARHARPTFVRGRTARGGNGYVAVTPGQTTVMPSPWGVGDKVFKLTPQRLAVFGDMVKGFSATQIAERQHRNIETVKSHAGYLRRETGAHDAASALIALVLAGRLSDRAVTVPDEVRIAPPVEADPTV